MKLILLAALFITQQTFAMDNQLGPHGGQIKMTQNLHSEVNADKDGSFHIFLLDAQLKNPTIKNSVLGATIKSTKNEMKLNCSVMGGSHFHCKSKDVRPKVGQLILKGSREKVEFEVSYDLSEFNEAAPKESGHSHHH